MPDRDEIKRIARDLLGRTSWFGFREYALLAKLLHPGERIDAMAIGRLVGGGLIGSQRLAVATDVRLLLVEKGFVTGRERVRELAWDEIAGATVIPPLRLRLELHDGERIELSYAQPPRQLGALADLARGRDAATPELYDLVRRKLGRMLAVAVEPNVLALAGVLEADEEVIDVASVAGSTDGLVALTTTRLLFLPTKGLGVGEPTVARVEDIRGVTLTDDGSLHVDDGGEGLRVGALLPRERAEALVVRLRPRGG